ncbi:MAG: methyltransferase [Bacteroidales bacterium]
MESYPPAILLKWIENLRFSLVKISRWFAPASVNIIEMVQGFYVARAIGVVADLNIAEHLKNGKKSIKELSVLTQTNTESLYRLMRMLASQGVFIEKNDKVFINNKLSETLLDKPESMRYMVIHQVNGINWKLFGDLKEVVTTGESTFKKHTGSDVFEYMEVNPHNNKVYNKAMTNSSLLISKAILSEYSFGNYNCIVDIGGGEGILLAMILKKYKNLKGINFDLPHVVSESTKTFEQYNVLDRIQLVSGNFFNDMPMGGDLYFLKSILHNLSDFQGIELLKKIKMILPVNGNILIFEPIIEANTGRYSFAKLYDTQMMVSSIYAKERTKQEFESLINSAGLKVHKVIKTLSPFSIIECTKI